MRVVLTGAGGFLGWHTRLRLEAQGEHTVVPVFRENWARLSAELDQADAVIHIAGINRANNPDDVEHGNIELAKGIADSVAARPSLRVVYANSTQSGNGTPYGTGKAKALELLRAAAIRSGATIIDVRLPNLFGEHGRPRYNSFVATFVDACVNDRQPTILHNNIPLLHAQDAAEALIAALNATETQSTPEPEIQNVRDVWRLLGDFHAAYAQGAFPDLSSKFRVDLFNTYRAALFPTHYPIRLTPHEDERGTFVETIRSKGGTGQSSISTTAPGVTRGEHYHLHKVERFAVIHGEASIALRRMFTPHVITFKVSGSSPTAVDMPVGWAHKITNTGTETLITQFWSHDLFDPEAPDTYPASVEPATSKESAA